MISLEPKIFCDQGEHATSTLSRISLLIRAGSLAIQMWRRPPIPLMVRSGSERLAPPPYFPRFSDFLWAFCTSARFKAAWWSFLSPTCSALSFCCNPPSYSRWVTSYSGEKSYCTNTLDAGSSLKDPVFYQVCITFWINYWRCDKFYYVTWSISGKSLL